MTSGNLEMGGQMQIAGHIGSEYIGPEYIGPEYIGPC
jgi:hypothetical protein